MSAEKFHSLYRVMVFIPFLIFFAVIAGSMSLKAQNDLGVPPPTYFNIAVADELRNEELPLRFEARYDNGMVETLVAENSGVSERPYPPGATRIVAVGFNGIWYPTDGPMFWHWGYGGWNLCWWWNPWYGRYYLYWTWHPCWWW